MCVDAIYCMVSDNEYAAKLVANGKRQLLSYDNYEQQLDKLINILEKLCNNN